MAETTVEIGGNRYKLACRDGEEARLQMLANHVDEKAQDLLSTLGHVTENRLMLMAALLIADELFEARETGVVDPAMRRQEFKDMAVIFDDASEYLETLSKKIAVS